MKKVIFILNALAFSALLFCSTAAYGQNQPDPVYLRPNFINTGKVCSLILRFDHHIPNQYEFGVYSSHDSLVGSGVARKDTCIITVWGDNVQTGEVVDGALPDEELTVKAFDTTTKAFHEVSLSSIRDGINQIALPYLLYIEGYITAHAVVPFLPASEPNADPIAVCPSVSSGSFTVRNLGEGSSQIAVRDMLGNTVWNTNTTASEATFELGNSPAGSYFVFVSSKGETKAYRIALIK